MQKAKKSVARATKKPATKKVAKKVQPNFDFAMGANTVYKTNNSICAQKVIKTDKKGKVVETMDSYFKLTPERAKAYELMGNEKKARYKTQAKTVTFKK